jgi:hypothetical protein
VLDEKIARVKELIEKRETIDAELAQLLGIEAKKPRGRPRKEEQSDDKGTPLPLE